MRQDRDVPWILFRRFSTPSAQRLKQIPIRLLLTAPSLLPLVISVALVGGLSWWHGQETVSRLALQLQNEIGERVQLKLQAYLSAPQKVVRINRDAVRLKQLDLGHWPSVEQHLFAQLRQFDSVSGILIGTEQGALRAVNRRDGLNLLQLDPADQGQIRRYALNTSGERGKLLDSFRKPDPRQSPWYRVALQRLAGSQSQVSGSQASGSQISNLSLSESELESDQPLWSPVFQTPDNQDLSLNANLPIDDPATGKVIAVASAGVVLSVIDQFLDSIEVSPSGLVFILERNGNLIGSSTGSLPYQVQQPTVNPGQVDLSQINALDSADPAIRSTTQQLLSQFGSFTQIRGEQQLTFRQENGQQFVHVVPYQDALGLDWLIVVVIPKADLMNQINHNVHLTGLLCLAALAATWALGVLAATWMVKPMQQLSHASQALAAGDLAQQVPQDSWIQEVQETAQAFNQMAQQLSASFKQIETTNANLEAQVRERTAELQQALEFEDLLRRITEKVRDSLDEAQILQAVVQELGLGLEVQACEVSLYHPESRTVTRCYEYPRDEYLRDGYSQDEYPQAARPTQRHVQHPLLPFNALPELYFSLLQGQQTQFCLLPSSASVLASPDNVQDTEAIACLNCPIKDDQGILGDLRLFKPASQSFIPQEVRLVQQIANQCAIGLRQAHLYQRAQAQVHELERLHQAKDDFLNTVSHELRTPMANIRMATQLLEIWLERSTDSDALSEPTPEAIQRYLQILKDEGQREMTLINDLLDLSRLEAGMEEPYFPTTVDPKTWISHVVEPFMERARLQQQQLDLDLAPELPLLTTDLADLERILSELLNNACKYTPADGQIRVTADVTTEKSALHALPYGGDWVQPTPLCSSDPCGNYQETQTALHWKTVAQPTLILKVANSGTEIPESEQSRIFEKFYRIPSHDPWKHGGTGLGLALVKGLVERLEGKISVESHTGLTTFTVQLPMEISKPSTVVSRSA